jgi:hypothetical protein
MGQIAKSAIPAKAMMNLKAQLDTRCPTANRNPTEGNKMAKDLRPAANRFPPMAMNA